MESVFDQNEGTAVARKGHWLGRECGVELSQVKETLVFPS